MDQDYQYYKESYQEHMAIMGVVYDQITDKKRDDHDSGDESWTAPDGYGETSFR